ncbi:MAG: HAD family hydrolase [Anaerolineae bacterium]|jgi:HAD superfamily hydrolase (TIGR01509 family)
MALLKFGGRSFDADLVAFDKDGTLIEFEVMWGRLTITWVEHLVAETGDKGLRQELYRSLGYDPQRQRTLPRSPLAIATTHQLQTIAAVTLYRQGVPWPEAEDRTRRAFAATHDLPLADLVRPTGDVAGLLARLQGTGVRVAMVTTDHRAETEETLHLMGIAHLVDDAVCGDDGLPTKPAPDMLQAVCGRLGIEPARTAVVGDTVADLLMAGRAGAGLKVAVLTGAGEPALLQKQADVVLRSIDEIAVVRP